MCIILEFAPYNRRRCLMFAGNGVLRTALLIVDITPRVHWRWALGLRDVVRAVPR